MKTSIRSIIARRVLDLPGIKSRVFTAELVAMGYVLSSVHTALAEMRGWQELERRGNKILERTWWPTEKTIDALVVKGPNVGAHATRVLTPKPAPKPKRKKRTPAKVKATPAQRGPNVFAERAVNCALPQRIQHSPDVWTKLGLACTTTLYRSVFDYAAQGEHYFTADDNEA